jgi:hypothetical protein
MDNLVPPPSHAQKQKVSKFANYVLKKKKKKKLSNGIMGQLTLCFLGFISHAIGIACNTNWVVEIES